MTTTAKAYRKKPVVIDALQFDGSNHEAVLAWIDNATSHFNHAHGAAGHLTIQTLEGTMTVSAGDFVIRGVKGEFYPCKPDIFDATYEPVDTSRESS